MFATGTFSLSANACIQPLMKEEQKIEALSDMIYTFHSVTHAPIKLEQSRFHGVNSDVA